MNDTFGSADDGALLSAERAVDTGRRITARHARKQKRERTQELRRVRHARHASKGWLVGVAVAVTVVAVGAGAAIALGGGGESGSGQAESSDARSGPGSNDRSSATSTSTGVPGLGADTVDGLYIQFTDALGTVQYMYCTKGDGCGLVDVAADGTTTIAATQVGGVWHRETRDVLQKDPCVGIGGSPGDLVVINTTDLRPVGSQRIKGVKVPARIAGTISRTYETPEQANCTFEQFTGGTLPVDAPVTEFTPGVAPGGG